MHQIVHIVNDPQYSSLIAEIAHEDEVILEKGEVFGEEDELVHVQPNMFYPLQSLAMGAPLWSPLSETMVSLSRWSPLMAPSTMVATPSCHVMEDPSAALWQTMGSALSDALMAPTTCQTMLAPMVPSQTMGAPAATPSCQILAPLVAVLVVPSSQIMAAHLQATQLTPPPLSRLFSRW